MSGLESSTEQTSLIHRLPQFKDSYFRSYSHYSVEDIERGNIGCLFFPSVFSCTMC